MAATNKVREELTKRFQEALSQGQLPWHCCWSQTRPQNAISGTRYHGVNALWLSWIAKAKGYADPRWCTFKQAEGKGWHIRKGEKAAHVEYWAYFDREKKKLLSWKDANEILRTDPQYAEKNLILSSKVFAVFNGQQMDGIPPYEKTRQTDIGDIRAKRDILIANMGISYREQGQQAYYSPLEDRITLPPEATFDSTYGYMATFLHECGHATGHASRMNRPMDGYGSNPESYAKEELRAEIASAFTVQELDLALTPAQVERETEQHMAYVQSWVAAIEKAPEALFQAIRDAEKVSDYLIEKGEFAPLLEALPAEAPALAAENAAMPEQPASEPVLTDAEAVMLEHEGQAALFEMGDAVPDPADALTHAEMEEPARQSFEDMFNSIQSEREQIPAAAPVLAPSMALER